MRTTPHQHSPPPRRCPECNAEVEAYQPARDPLECRYACGTTSLMLWNGTHVNGPTKADQRRQIAEWRRMTREVEVIDKMESVVSNHELATTLLAVQQERFVRTFVLEGWEAATGGETPAFRKRPRARPRK